MIVTIQRVDQEHWSTGWVPISYQKTLTKQQLQESFTFLWSDKFQVDALARAYHISATQIEIGDVWLKEKWRGVMVDGSKISTTFMKRVISKIWKYFPSATKISLAVSAGNIAAVRLYQRLGFQIDDLSTKKLHLGIEDEVSMVRHKRQRS